MKLNLSSKSLTDSQILETDEAVTLSIIFSYSVANAIPFPSIRDRPYPRASCTKRDRQCCRSLVLSLTTAGTRTRADKSINKPTISPSRRIGVKGGQILVHRHAATDARPLTAAVPGWYANFMACSYPRTPDALARLPFIDRGPTGPDPYHGIGSDTMTWRASCASNFSWTMER